MKLFSDAIAFVRQSPSILYSLFLMILIPVGLFFYAFFVITSFQQMLDVEISKKAETVIPLVQTFYKQIEEDPLMLRSTQLGEIQQANDIVDIIYLEPTSRGYHILSSFDETNIGQIITGFQYDTAWNDPRGIRTQVTDTKTGKRYWEVTQMIRSDEGQRVGLASVLIDVQSSFSNIQVISTTSYLVLIGIVLVLILFVANNARLIQHAYLFEQLQELDKQKDEFVSIAAHELRTPVTSIRRFLSNILDNTYGEAPKNISDVVQRTLDSTMRLSDLIEDLLEESHIEQGIEFEFKKLKPVAIIKEVIDQMQPQVLKKALKLVVNLDSKSSIRVDEERFHQVMSNMIANAIKYTAQGAVTVSASETPNQVRIVVEDEGMGISATDQEQLFRKFYRVKSQESNKIPGTGLGLWITKQLVEQMGGTIKLESIEGKGSRFIVNFPIVR